ncbi:MAG: hypothetical protein ACK55I_34265, partial [bacterium]
PDLQRIHRLVQWQDRSLQSLHAAPRRSPVRAVRSRAGELLPGWRRSVVIRPGTFAERPRLHGVPLGKGGTGVLPERRWSHLRAEGRRCLRTVPHQFARRG